MTSTFGILPFTTSNIFGSLSIPMLLYPSLDAASPVVAGHAYTVISAEIIDGQRYVTVYNPWGWDGRTWDDNSSDGLLRLSIEQIQDNYTAVVTSLV